MVGGYFSGEPYLTRVDRRTELLIHSGLLRDIKIRVSKAEDVLGQIILLSELS